MTTTRCVVYTRFSPRRHSEDCESCEAQAEACRAYAQAQGWEIAGEFSDRALSGADEDRPGLWAALDDLGRGDVLLVYRGDRIARDVYLDEVVRRQVRKVGATVATVHGGQEADTPEGRMIRQVLAAFSEYERRVIAARTSAAMRRHQAAGRRMSSAPPYGWRVAADSGRLEHDPAEQAAMDRCREIAQQGASLRAVARQLQAEGHPCRGKRWRHQMVAAILAR